MTGDKTFVIRRAVVAPMGLLVTLTVVLLVVCVVQGQPLAKVILLGMMILPLAALFVESAFRRVVIDEEGVTAFRPLRQTRVLFSAVTSLETVQVRSRIFVTLCAGADDFLIISNSYAGFPELLNTLIAAVPEGTITEETQKMALRPTLRHADIFTAWFAVSALVYVLIAQFRG